CYALAVIERTEGYLKLATVAWLKEPLESWRARAANQVPKEIAAPAASYTLPTIGTGGCIDDTWTATAGPPDRRDSHTAVWTGSEMIVWGGFGDISALNTGGRYNPSTDSWTATSITNTPTARDCHTAVWTSSEMVVWGGFDGFNTLDTGGRYNPNTDSWTATSASNAPSARADHTAVWSDSEMVIWGGSGDSGAVNTGGRYNP